VSGLYSAAPSQAALLSGLATSQVNPHCSITMDTESTGEIRTKVFRMGAPLLRSTIPVSLGRGGGYGGYGDAKKPPAAPIAAKAKNAGDSDSDEDVETVLSMSDHEQDDGLQGHLSVTLDFPC